MLNLLIEGILETFVMVSFSMVGGMALGIPLGMMLFNFSAKGFSACHVFYKIMSFIVNIFRSLPFVIFVILFIPVTRSILGTSIGTLAASLPLMLVTCFLVARIIEDVFGELSKTLGPLGLSLGLSSWSILNKIFLTEARPLLAAQFSNLAISVLGFSTMSGVVGGGGLGDLALRYGYQRYDFSFMMMILVSIFVLVEIIQRVGKFFQKR